MMSPTRRVAHSLATNALVSSSLFVDELGREIERLFLSPILPLSFTFASPLVR